MSAYRFDKLKILVVDDNVHMRKLVVTILQAFGVVHIFEAESGERAWAVLRESSPDVVVLDWMMEGLSGLDVVQMIRSDPQTPNPFVPVIMITGHTERHKVEAARDAGVTEFIAKPITAQSLFARIAEILERPRAFVRCESYFGPDRRRKAQEDYAGPWRRHGDGYDLQV